MAASRRLEVIEAVEALYGRVAKEVDRVRPHCEMSGRCCRFEEFDHRLYVTAIELAAFLCALRGHPERQITQWDGTGCPFQRGGACTVHEFRPFGCRMYYCDPTARVWQMEQYERFHARLKGLHERLGVVYVYMEWRAALRMMELIP